MRSKAVSIVEFWTLRTEATGRIIAKTLRTGIVMLDVTFRGQCLRPREAAAQIYSLLGVQVRTPRRW